MSLRTATDLMNEDARKDCLAVLDGILNDPGRRRLECLADWAAHWAEGLRALLINPDGASDELENHPIVKRAYEEATEAEDECARLKRVIEGAADMIDGPIAYKPHQVAEFLTSGLNA